jgi:hypothetical protein
MRFNYLLLPTLLFMFFGFAALAQPTCEDPIIITEDDFENYAAGDLGLQNPDTWFGGIVTPEITANSGVNAIEIDSDNDLQSTIFLADIVAAEHYIIDVALFIPEGNVGGSINFADSDGPYAVLNIDGDGSGTLETSEGLKAFSFPNDVWFDCYLFLDFENDVALLNINQQFIDSWLLDNTNFTGIVFIEGEAPFYIDDLRVREIPPAESGQYCQTAEVLTEPGTYSVPELSCWGGSLDQGGNGSGFLAYWFSYTPEEDGVLTVSSCEGGADTRGWILSGDCLDLSIVGVNDDQCDIGGGSGNLWASLREAVVTAGTQYFIVWDDAWDTNGFDFELSLNTTDPPAEGQFCQSAQQITPGIYFVEEITGNAAVAGPNINNTTSSTTAYAQAQWYKFIPTVDGYMSISNCEIAGSDTHFFVYTGDCSTLDGLTLVAQDDNGCESTLLTSSLDSIEVVAGTTYYIEWMDRWSDELFEWELGFEATVPAVTVSLQVDMTLETVDPAGVFIAGSFSDFQNLPMEEVSTNIYGIELLLPQNTTQEYKFKNGPDGWENIDTSIGDDCTTGGYGNRFVMVNEDDIMEDAVCFGYCVGCTAVNTEEVLSNKDIKLFPNPVKAGELIQLQWGQPFSASDQTAVLLTDALGRQVQTGVIDRTSQRISISTRGISPGVYQLQIYMGDQSLSRAVVIQ